MNVAERVSLAEHSTMGLGGYAAYYTEVLTRMEVLEALSWAQTKQLPVIMIGGGSNIIWQDSGYPGLVIHNAITGYEVFEEDETNTYLTIGSGENWDSVVARSVAAGLTGIEALSLIPGSTGAVPIQNVGAYGQDISQTLVTIEAFDTQVKDFVTLPGYDCGFGYRTSRFKTADRGRFFITAISIHLTKGTIMPPFYPALADYLSQHGITEPTPAAIREAVIAIRSAKLPDPMIIKNCGSFFANPLISQMKLASLSDSLGVAIPHWPNEDGQIKISAAWLIEHAGLAQLHDQASGMAIWEKQPLVFVNEHASQTAQLLQFKQLVVDCVAKTFGITLIQEPELLPFAS